MESALTPFEFKSREDVRRYTATLAARKVQDDVRVRFWHGAKRMSLTLVLAASFLTYYLLSVAVQTMTLPHIDFPIMHIAIKSGPKGFGAPH